VRLAGTGLPDGRDVEDAAARAAASPWARVVARFGLASKAVVYAVVAALALAVAAHAGGKTTDARGALATLAAAPWGRALVAILAAGLACHGVWFVLAGLADPGRQRRDAKGLAMRAGRVVAGIAHVLLAASAVQLALGATRVRSGDAAARSWTARALELPAGTLLVLAGAAIALGVGAHQIRNGWRCRKDPKLRTGDMGPRLRRWAPRIGFAGFVAQGAVVVLVGVFLVQAALARDAREATGFDGALAWIAGQQPHGTLLLAAAAVGLLAYAAWAAVEARYKRLPA
jgi:hypothetical protein